MMNRNGKTGLSPPEDDTDNGIISPGFIRRIFRDAQNSEALILSGASLCFGQTETACSHYWMQ